jgi:hypothetical protein
MAVDLERNLQLFARWESVVPYFSMKEKGENDAYVRIIKPMLSRLKKNPSIEICEISSYPINYYGFFAYPKGKQANKIRGLTAYLSLLAPLAVIGRKDGRKSDTGEIYGSFLLTIEDIISPNDAQNEFEKIIIQEVSSSDYDFLLRTDVDKPLPKNIRIKHHSQADKRYFHAIFDYDENY